MIIGKAFHYGTTSQEEEDLVRRLLLAQDEIVKMKPGFLAAAKRFKRRLKPHGDLIFSGPDRMSDKAQEAVEVARDANARMAKAFAKKWDLPHPAPREVDPVYLADHAYSGSTTVAATCQAVMVRTDRLLPIVEFQVDIRHPTNVVVDRLRRQIQEGRKMWKDVGGAIYEVKEKSVKRVEDMLVVHRGRCAGKTHARIAEEMGITEKQIYNLKKELSEIADDPCILPAARFATRDWQETEHASRVNIERDDRRLRRCVF